MDTLTAAVPGLLTLTDLVDRLVERFGPTNPRLKITKEKDIKEPTSDFVVAVYVEYLRILSIDINANQNEIPDFYLDTMPMINIFKSLRKIFERQVASDFSMSDLISPTYKRTLGGMAVLDNYITYIEVARDKLFLETDAIQEKVEVLQEICEKKDKLIAEYNKKATARSQRAGKVAEMNILLSAKKCSISKLTSKVNEIISRETDLMNKLQAEKTKINALKLKINNLEENIKLQKNLVVPDPEQIEREDMHKKASLEQINQQISDLKVRLDESKKENQVFEQMFEIKSHFEKYMETTCKLKKNIERKDAQLSNKDGTLETLGIESKSKRDEYMKKKAAANRLNENLSSEKAKADSRMVAMEKSVRELEKERTKLEKKINVNSTSYNKLLPLIKEMKNLAEKCVETIRQSEEYVVEKKSSLDLQVKLEVAEVDKILHQVQAAVEDLHAKAAKDVTDINKLLNEQRAKDDAEGRSYYPDR